MTQMPAISLAAVPGRRQPVIEAAAEAERRGFTGIFCPSLGDALGLCLSIAHVTTTIPFGTSVQPIYLQHPAQLASQASYLNEVSKGRFYLGIGVSHGPVHQRLGAEVGKPLTDIRNYVDALRAADPAPGKEGIGLPPIVLATLRDKMVDLSTSIGEGAVWANASLNDMPRSVKRITDARGGDAGGFFIGNMIPTVIDDDRDAAANRNRATLTGYVSLPNYRNYWKNAGYEEEMTAIERAFQAGERDKVPSLMSERWLSSCTLYGPVAEVREGVERWFDAGVTTPILVPSSAKGNQLVAIQELFDAFA